jgi:hypothetical protein
MEQSEIVGQAQAALDAAQQLAELPDEQLLLSSTPDSWNVAQHLEHVSLANLRSLKAARLIAGGGGEPREGKAEVMARRVLRSGTIPRGADAPDGTQPAESGNPNAARANLATCLEMLREVESADLTSGTVPHPYLGPFDGLEWIRFVEIHTQHHLAQIRAMLEMHG